MLTSEILPSPRPLVRFSSERILVNQSGYIWVQNDARYLKYLFTGDFMSLRDRLCSYSHSGPLFQYIPQFGFYEYATEVSNGRAINIFEVIRIMKSEALKKKCEAIRQAQQIGDKNLKAKLKKELPYITHTGLFIPRRNDGLILPGFTFQLDIDKINNADELLSQITKDKQLNVLLACKSVSGNGVKAILFLKELLFLRDTWNHEQYRQTYHSATDILFDYFKEQYNVSIDTQMKSISQPFFLFYSPEMFINKNLIAWI